MIYGIAWQDFSLYSNFIVGVVYTIYHAIRGHYGN
ncbi:hypothetical protein [Vibrio phage vB_VpaP_SJSY21]|nr:hypothetical protein [Vibrio phage vB_VpaP_SJSY21]